MGGMKSAVPTGDFDGGNVGVPGEGFSAPLPAPQSSFLQGLSSGGLKLSNPVGRGAVNSPDDVFQVESALSNADLLGRPPGRVFGDDTFDAIKTAQGKLNADSRLGLAKSPLKVDGLINDDGPTQAATRKLAADVLSKRTPTGPKPRTRLPGVPPVKTLLNKPVPSAAPSVPGRDTLEQTAKRLPSKPPLAQTPPAPPKAPALSGDDFSELQRLAGALKTSTKPGPVAKDIADAFRGNPKGTAGEFMVVRNALEKSGTPEQVQNLTQGVRAELSPEDRSRFDKLIGPGGEGQKGEKPGPARVETKPTEKPKPKIEWNERAEPRDFRPRKLFRTDGPIKVKHSTKTMGADGIWYGVKWHPLDKNGNRAQVFEKIGDQKRELPSPAAIGLPNNKTFEPPWNNKHGWEVELWIPPQQGTNANSAGNDLDVFLPKGKKQLKRRQIQTEID